MRKLYTRIPAILMLILFLFPSMTAFADMPNINGSSAITFDVETGEIIYTKNIDEIMYPASITKLMTALILSEEYSSRQNDYLKYPREARLEVPYAMYYNLKPLATDEEISANEILHALLLGSANDAATAIAMNISGSVEAFAERMNVKAKSLGMNSTHFVNATGLHDPDHYSTAYDLMLLLKAAYDDPWLRSAASNESYTVKTKVQTLGNVVNKNKNLGISGNVFGKTGYTGEAGRCLSAVYVLEGRTLGSVILNSINDPGNVQVFNDTTSLVLASAEEEKMVKIAQGQEVTTLKLPYKTFRYFGPTKEIELPIVAKDSLSFYKNDMNEKEALQEMVVRDLDPFMVQAGNDVGAITFTHRTGIQKISLLAKLDTGKLILEENLFSYILIVIVTFLVFAFLVLLIIGNVRKKKRARMRRIEGRRSQRNVRIRR
ncbi:MAG TPA: D-alanyl-D-alanine carboxypeptidase family protein [Clostridiaceae bacterium]|nr:D-alanyl-D-alanine carboxypeptidase family protein [Clostridiaceae bacterium]